MKESQGERCSVGKYGLHKLDDAHSTSRTNSIFSQITFSKVMIEVFLLLILSIASSTLDYDALTSGVRPSTRESSG